MSKKMNNKRLNKAMKYLPFVLAALSGVLYMLSIHSFHPIIGFIAFIPLLIALNNAALKRTIVLTIVFGSVFGVMAFNWMFSTGVLYSNTYTFGLIGMLVSILIFILFYLLIFIFFRFLTQNKINRINIFILAALVVLIEVGFSEVFVSYPFHYLRFGLSMLGSVYTIQLAEIGGIYILSFFTILFNGFFALAIIKKRFPTMGGILLTLFLLTNYFIYTARTNLVDGVISSKKQVSFNIITPNYFSPVNWGNQNESFRIQTLMLTTNIESAKSMADINVWPESVLPWTYETVKIGFVDKIMEQHQGSGSYLLMGFNTSINDFENYNSAYLFNDKGEIISRYDKRFPIKALEAPLGDAIPIVTNDFGVIIKPGNHAKVMPTEKSNLGVFICNESSTHKAIRPLILDGADILVNISNDSWFRNTFIIDLHFYGNRIRSVSTRRDIIINSNGGISGAISSNGDIKYQEASNRTVMRRINAQPREGKTLYTAFPYFLPLISLLLIIGLKIYTNLKSKSSSQL